MRYFKITLALCLLLTPLSLAASFRDKQLTFRRVRFAYDTRRAEVKKIFADKSIGYPADSLFLRVFKREKVVEVWARGKKSEPYKALISYPICQSSGELGPKRKEGDGQVPEGFYQIESFNPMSQFHLSLKVGYPNLNDRRRNTAKRLGGDIFIHGNCVSIGCMPITDTKIEELYIMAIDTLTANPTPITVHIFPTALSDATMKNLKLAYASDKQLVAFWENLKPVYDYFEAHHELPKIGSGKKGEYEIQR